MFYGFGVQSAEICVAMSDQTKTSFTGKKTKNFTSYHSFGLVEDFFKSYVGTSFRPARFAVTKLFIKSDKRNDLKLKEKQRKIMICIIYSFVMNQVVFKYLKIRENMNSIASEVYRTIKNYSRTYQCKIR